MIIVHTLNITWETSLITVLPGMSAEFETMNQSEFGTSGIEVRRS